MLTSVTCDCHLHNPNIIRYSQYRYIYIHMHVYNKIMRRLPQISLSICLNRNQRCQRVSALAQINIGQYDVLIFLKSHFIQEEKCYCSSSNDFISQTNNFTFQILENKKSISIKSVLTNARRMSCTKKHYTQFFSIICQLFNLHQPWTLKSLLCRWNFQISVYVVRRGLCFDGQTGYYTVLAGHSIKQNNKMSAFFFKYLYLSLRSLAFFSLSLSLFLNPHPFPFVRLREIRQGGKIMASHFELVARHSSHANEPIQFIGTSAHFSKVHAITIGIVFSKNVSHLSLSSSQTRYIILILMPDSSSVWVSYHSNAAQTSTSASDTVFQWLTKWMH